MDRIRIIKIKNMKKVIGIFLFLVSYMGYAQVTQGETDFAPVYSKVLRGNFTTIGNALVAPRRAGAGDNRASNMTVLSSSEAILTQPTIAGGCETQIKWAGLYWSGTYNREDDSMYNVTLTKSGARAQRVTAIQASYTTGQGRMYYAFADVTDYVKQHQWGTYTVSDVLIQDGGGVGITGGWTLVVVYENEKDTNRSVNIFNGFANIVRGQQDKTLVINGLNTPPSGTIKPHLGVLSIEGDREQAGDFFHLVGYDDLTPRTGGDPNNFFDASIPGKGDTNHYGFGFSDIVLENNSIKNNVRSVTFQYGTKRDSYATYSIALAVEHYSPEPLGIIGNVKQGTQTLRPGDKAQFKVDIYNRGDEPLVAGTKVYIPLPVPAVAGSVRIVNTSDNTITHIFRDGTPAEKAIPASANHGSPNAIPTKNGYIEFTINKEIPVDANRGTSRPLSVAASFTYEVQITTDCSRLPVKGCASTLDVNMEGFIRAHGKTSRIYTKDNEERTSSRDSEELSCTGLKQNNTSGFTIDRGNNLTGSSCIDLNELNFCQLTQLPQGFSSAGVATHDGTTYNFNFRGQENKTYVWALKDLQGRAANIGFGTNGKYTVDTNADGTLRGEKLIPNNTTLSSGTDAKTTSDVKEYNLELYAEDCPTDKKVIKVKLHPFPQGTILIPNGTEVCSSGTLQLSAQVPVGNAIKNGTWRISQNPTSGTATISQTGLLTTTNAVGTIKVTYTPPANNCQQVADAKEVTITAKPLLTLAYQFSAKQVCKGENVSVTFTNSLNEAVVVTIGGQEYEIAQRASRTIALLTNANTGNFRFSASARYKNGAQCGNTIFTNEEISVRPTLTGSISASETILCHGGSTTITLNNTTANQTATMELLLNGRVIATKQNVGATAVAETISSANLPVGTHTFSARIKYANAPVCEQTLNSIQVVVNANPTAQISGTGDYCTGESVLLPITLTGKTPYTLVYKENQTEKTIQISQNRHNLQITPTANVTFTLISVTDANGCSSALSGATASATIRIKEGMSVTITTDKNRYSLGSKNGVFVVSGKRGGKIFYRITGTNLLQEATFVTNTLQIPIPTNKVGEKTLTIERTEYLGCSVEVSVSKTIKVTGVGFLNPTLRFRSGK